MEKRSKGEEKRWTRVRTGLKSGEEGMEKSWRRDGKGVERELKRGIERGWTNGTRKGWL